MNKKLFVSLSALVLASCADTVQEDLSNVQTEPLAESTTDCHHVSYSDIVALTKAQNSGTRAYADQEPKIECITDKHDTLLYIHQKPGGGWTIYSSDTRVPAIIADSEEGTTEDLLECEAIKEWLEWTKEDMATISKLPDNKLKFTKQEMDENRAFWRSISSPDEYVRENLELTRGHGHVLDSTLLNPDPTIEKGYIGHWVFRFSDTYTEDYDVIPRLTTTNWHQDSPYNRWCPFKYNYEQNIPMADRAPAGCVPVAVAQMLYFLHNKLGVPQTAPSEASVSGNVEDGWQSNQTNYAPEVWGEMDASPWKEAMLMANIAKRLDGEYTNGYCRCNAADLVTKVFNPYGLLCTFTAYSTSLLKSNLLNGYPVIIGAKDATGESCHCFIVDRYKRTRTVRVNHYDWVFDEWPAFKPMPAVEERVEYSYSSPVISMISMNWGWKLAPNTGWYTLTGDWIDTYPGQGGQSNWNTDRRMWCNFQVLNNN